MGSGSDDRPSSEPANGDMLRRLAMITSRPVGVADAAAGRAPRAAADPVPTEPVSPSVAEPAACDPSLLVARRTRMVPIATFDVPAPIRPIAPPDGWTDVLTGADGPRLWDRTVLTEQARVARYRRPVTVAFAELVGIEQVAATWGWDVAGRALASCARRLSREIRTSDHIARLEQARFGILLTETSEIAAINFVERARASCERELKAIGPEVTIGFGWASPPDKGDLSDAIAIALTRLSLELAAQADATD